MAGLYIHIPFCRSKCLYCDFFSVGARLVNWPEYRRLLLEEFRHRKDFVKGDFRTIYIGGGTPSLFPSGELALLLKGFREIAGDRWCMEEATIEVNPDDITHNYVADINSMGFTRVSMGVQSMDDNVLSRIGRRHNAATVMQAISMLRKADFDLSLDVMFALPGQTPESWNDTLTKICQIHPEHLSSYALMYEDGTPLTRMVQSGKIEAADDDAYLEMYSMMIEKLKWCGYEHYEISNFALPGHCSRHNSSYWTGTPYLGLGPGAHSYDGLRCRQSNISDLKAYMCGEDVTTTETLTDIMLLEEYLLTRMRTREGIDLNDMKSRFGSLSLPVIDSVKQLTQDGMLQEYSPGHIHLTPQGIMMSDSVILSLAENT